MPGRRVEPREEEPLSVGPQRDACSSGDGVLEVGELSALVRSECSNEPSRSIGANGPDVGVAGNHCRSDCLVAEADSKNTDAVVCDVESHPS